jgi:membrane protease YdiL (CAAX protease family)
MKTASLSQVFWSFAILLGISGLGSAVALAALDQPLSIDALPADPAVLLSLVLSSAVGLLASLVFAIRCAGWSCVRFSPLPERVMAWALALVPVALTLSYFWTLFLESWTGPIAPQLFVQGVLEADDTRVLAVAGFYAVIGAPILEEALFRGFMLPVMIQRVGRWPGIFLNAALFGLIHAADPWAIVPVVGVGVMAAWLRDKSGGLGAGILFHATNNLCALILVSVGY